MTFERKALQTANLVEMWTTHSYHKFTIGWSTFDSLKPPNLADRYCGCIGAYMLPSSILHFHSSLTTMFILFVSLFAFRMAIKLCKLEMNQHRYGSLTLVNG